MVLDLCWTANGNVEPCTLICLPGEVLTNSTTVMLKRGKQRQEYTYRYNPYFV